MGYGVRVKQLAQGGDPKEAQDSGRRRVWVRTRMLDLKHDEADIFLSEVDD